MVNSLGIAQSMPKGDMFDCFQEPKSNSVADVKIVVPLDFNDSDDTSGYAMLVSAAGTNEDTPIKKSLPSDII